MPLDFNWSKVENYKEVCWRHEDGRVNGLTEAVIWATMTVGIGEITNENYEEFHRRLLEADICAGFKGENFTLEHIRKHIGLSTNVSELTRAAWEKRLKLILAEEVEHRKRQETKEKETA